MKRRFLSICNACVSIAIALVCASSGQMAHATFVEFVQQVGGDVVATGSGSINTAALTPEGTAPNVAILNPGAGLALFGPATGTETDEYSGFTSGSANFGGFSGVVATSGSGDLVGVFGLGRSQPYLKAMSQALHFQTPRRGRARATPVSASPKEQELTRGNGALGRHSTTSSWCCSRCPSRHLFRCWASAASARWHSSLSVAATRPSSSLKCNSWRRTSYDAASDVVGTQAIFRVRQSIDRRSYPRHSR